MVPPPPTDPALLASELRAVLGQLVRRLRAERTFPLAQVTVLGRLDREGALSVSELAGLERVRPQSMAQTVRDLEAAALVSRRPDPGDGRRALVELTTAGHDRLEADRRVRVGWLAEGITEDLTEAERQTLRAATGLLRRLGERERRTQP